MKQLIRFTFFLLTITSFAQNPCEYSSNVTDSIGVYKATKDYIMTEKNFGSTSSYIFFALVSTDGTPTLNMQQIVKSKDFINAKCFDKNSKIIMQLQNGAIVTLYHINQENCGTLIQNTNGFDNRINTGFFMFLKESIEELKKSPVSLMRIKYLTDVDDYPIQNELISEMDGKMYHPSTFFMENLKCIE